MNLSAVRGRCLHRKRRLNWRFRNAVPRLRCEQTILGREAAISNSNLDWGESNRAPAGFLIYAKTTFLLRSAFQYCGAGQGNLSLSAPLSMVREPNAGGQQRFLDISGAVAPHGRKVRPDKPMSGPGNSESAKPSMYHGQPKIRPLRITSCVVRSVPQSLRPSPSHRDRPKIGRVYFLTSPCGEMHSQWSSLQTFSTLCSAGTVLSLSLL
jgi:hypothetical protein